jgi:hypothetical protein
MTARIGVRSKLSRAVVIATAVAVLGAGCADDKIPASGVVDLAELDVGGYATAPRPVHDQPSLPEGTLLEGIRMAEAVADSSQFDSLLLYLWRADPIPHTASLTPVLGEAGKGVLDRHGWIAGYRASYADRPQLPDGNAPPAYVGLSILLLRFPDEAAARGAPAALEVTNWKDLPRTVAVALPNHPDVSARYTPGTGALLVDTAVGPFVVHLLLEAPPDGIETRVRDLDPVIDAQRRLIANFGTTPVAEIPALPRDPDGLLARMVSTDPAHQPPASATFAVYGPTGALRDQTPMIRKDKLYEKWGVDRFAVSGDQHLYRLRDHQAALAMRDEFIAESSGREHPIEADPKVPDERCFQVDNPLPNTPAFACRVIVDSLYTVVRGDTATSAKQKAAAQYVLLAAGR